MARWQARDVTDPVFGHPRLTAIYDAPDRRGRELVLVAQRSLRDRPTAVPPTWRSIAEPG